MTSTYPRWSGDATPDFIERLVENTEQAHERTYVLAPHAARAKHYETIGRRRVIRYRYSVPATTQNITYDGGGVDKVKINALYGIKLVLLMASQTAYALWLVIFRRIEVINAHWIVPQGFIAIVVKLITGTPVVVSVHGGDVQSLNGKIMRAFKRFVLRRADAVIVNSSATRAECKKIYAEREYKIIPMGVDFTQFTPRQPSSQLQQKYQLNSKETTFLFVGRLAKVKGTNYLIEAAQRLVADGVAFKLLIAGDGPLKSEIEAFIAKHNLSRRVQCIGWIDKRDLNALYSSVDVLVGPSVHEAQGLVFAEALASGTPVIASRVGGIVDIVKDGHNGFLVPVGDVEGLVERMKTLATQPKLLAKFKANTRSGVEEKYSWQNVATQYAKEIKGVIR